MATLRVGRARATLPGKLITSSELNAARLTGVGERVESEGVVVARLVTPGRLKNLLSKEDALKGLARVCQREVRGLPDAARLLYLNFLGGATVDKADDLRTLLDLQHLCDFEVITVQQCEGVSPDDFAALYAYASRWADEVGLDKPLMPVLLASSDLKAFEGYLRPLLEREIDCLGVDMRGRFAYFTLRALEGVRKANPSIWIHAFQIPLKVRFAGRLTPCSQLMLMPLFGIDSASRWVIPPPPVPLTKDRINFFERTAWETVKRKEFRERHGDGLTCGCPTCEEAGNLENFFAGKVFEALCRAKAHDHFAQRDELEASGKRIEEGSYVEFLRSKRGPRAVLEELGKPRT